MASESPVTVALIVATIISGASTGYTKALKALMPPKEEAELPSWETVKARVKALVSKDDGPSLLSYLMGLDPNNRREACRYLKAGGKATNQTPSQPEDEEAERYARFVAWEKSQETNKATTKRGK